jgi:NAD(P)-dependent dehydrogenase (short-subunit alcohol dehydrogenase family)
LATDDRRVWVTGASRGLGLAIARGFADAGCRVAVTARSVADLADFGFMVLPGSVADFEDMSRSGAAIKEAWGGLDVLINCAGVSQSMTRSEDVGMQEWNEVLSVNLSGTFRCCQVASTLMTGSPAAIVNVSSIHGVAGMPRMASYSASKGGVDALTRTLALEWAPRGIRVNAVCPGYFSTEMTAGLRANDVWSKHLTDRVPLGRFGEPGELVPAVMFLASPAAAYITGTCLTVDGGWTAQ